MTPTFAFIVTVSFENSPWEFSPIFSETPEQAVDWQIETIRINSQDPCFTAVMPWMTVENITAVSVRIETEMTVVDPVMWTRDWTPGQPPFPKGATTPFVDPRPCQEVER